MLKFASDSLIGIRKDGGQEYIFTLGMRPHFCVTFYITLSA